MKVLLFQHSHRHHCVEFSDVASFSCTDNALCQYAEKQDTSFLNSKKSGKIEDLTRVVISYEIYETSLWRVS